MIIVVCLSGEEDEILTKQLAMLGERHHADVVRADMKKAEEILSGCEADTLFISDNEGLLALARERGISTNTPAKMRESYQKAMEMLKNLGIRRQ